MLHDRTASTVALARNILMGVDKEKLETPVQTHTLILLLETLIDLGTPGVFGKISDGAAKTVAASMVAVSGVARDGER